MISDFIRDCKNWGSGIANVLEDELKKALKEEVSKDGKLPEIAEFLKHIDRPDRPIIQAASSTMRQKESFGGYFKPNVYAFGPIHHGNPDLRRGQRMKVQLVVYFLYNFSDMKRDLDIFSGIMTKKEEIDSQYGNKEEIEGRTFSSSYMMFFTDSCALLCYMYLSSKSQLAAFCQMGIESCDDDLFILDNQIPYTVIDELIINHLSQDKKVTIRQSIDDFVNKHCTKLGLDFQDKSQIIQQNKVKPYHLLDLLWIKAGCTDHRRAGAASTISDPPHHVDVKHQKPDGRASSSSSPQHSHKTLPDQPQPNQPHAQLEEQQPRTQTQTDHKQQQPRRPRWHSVQDLKARRVKLIPSKNIWLRDISFEIAGCFSGVLKVHPIIVEPSTIKKVVNLIAYELSPDFSNDREFISYLCFLGSHIATLGDVSELRSANVLQHSLPSDDFVFKLFQDVATNLEPNPNSYEHVKKCIEEYCDSAVKSKIATWWSAAATEYCKSPWTVIAVLAATLALILTVVQTYYAIHPKGDDSDKKPVHHIRKFLLN